MFSPPYGAELKVNVSGKVSSVLDHSLQNQRAPSEGFLWESSLPPSRVSLKRSKSRLLIEAALRDTFALDIRATRRYG